MDKMINDMIDSVMKTAGLSAFIIQEIEEMNLGSTAIEAFIYSLALTLHKEYHEVDIKRVGFMLYTGGEDDEESV